MGRTRKTAAQKRREGNAGKRSRKKREPALDPLGDLAPPAWLPAEAKKQWRRVVLVLDQKKILKDLDQTSLEAYCVVYHRWKQAARRVEREGLLVMTRNGFKQENPAISLEKKYLAELRSWSVEFGMTPAARTKVQVSDDDPKGKEKGKKDSGEDFFTKDKKRPHTRMGASTSQ